MTEQTRNPFAPPEAAVADVRTGDAALASRGARFLAALIDVVIQVALLFAIAQVTGWSPLVDPDSMQTIVSSALVGLVGFLAVHGWLLVRHGQTVGKKVLGLRIVRPDGSRVDPWRVLGLRYCASGVLAALPAVGWIYALVDCLFIFRASRRCLHDLIADTIVVKT